MSKRFISFGSIDAFRTTIKNVKKTAQYVDFNEELQRPNFDKSIKMPVITVTGSEKIHGTNAAVCFSIPDGFWVQSRKNIITAEKDNVGCAFSAYENEDNWLNIIQLLAIEHNINLNSNVISIFFEWSGGNIQKKSALTGLEKKSMIFQYFKVSPLEPKMISSGEEDTKSSKWLETCETGFGVPIPYINWLDNKEANIFNIINFPTVSIEIDFNEPLMSQNKMIEMVETLEKNSPVGKQFGIDGNIGEGYVFTFKYKDSVQRFKVKGYLHSKGDLHSKGSGKVKTLKPVNEALENKKIEFVNNFACTESRLEQMFTEIVHSTHNGDKTLMSMKDMGIYISLVIDDVRKEETDVMLVQNLDINMINSMISKVARSYFQDKL